MLHRTPSITELVAAVREFLTIEVVPATEGSLSFRARVAANALSIVERELASPNGDDWFRDQLASVGAQSEDDLAQLVRTNEQPGDIANLLPVLTAITRERLRVANPAYLDGDIDDDPRA